MNPVRGFAAFTATKARAMRRRPYRYPLRKDRISGVFLLLFLLGACLPPALPRVVKIGLVAPFEGRYRYVGYDAIYAARLAVREINAAGGIGGWRLELTAYDDRADPEMARAAARNLITIPDVVAVIGHYRETSTAAAATLYAEADMPLLVVGAWLTATAAPVWLMLPAAEQVAEAMVTLAADRQTAAAGDLSGGVWGEGPLATAVAAAWRSRGYHAAGMSPTFPEVVFSVLPPTETATRLVEWRAAGWRGMLIGDWRMAAAEFEAIAGTAGEEATFVTPYPLPQDVPDLAAWCAAYRAVGPHVPEPGVYARPTYEAVYALADALAAAIEAEGRPSRAAVQASGRVTGWNAPGYRDAMPLYVYRWETGKAHLVSGSK